ncbi:MAG: efflux RND transporter periplasmic adaptor subunit [Sulfurimonas sp.]|nr:efflux RND transporter periplasmic adaptor subunit [Sulfurimonas sp.]
MKQLSLIFFTILLFLSGCSEKHEAHTQAVEEKIEPEPVAITDYTKQTELFVEFDQFVLNQESTFLAHFTYMDTFKPFTEGYVKACLTYLNQITECFDVDSPVRKGIFKPVAIPSQSGKVELDITVEQGNIKQTHKLGSFQVYESNEKIPTHAEQEEDDGISYLKEQQWEVEFATHIATKKLLKESVSTFAKIEVPTNQEYFLSAPVAGIVTTSRELGVGSLVSKNMELAHITPLLGQKEDISTLKFELKKAEINLMMKRDENERVQKLKTRNAVSQKRIVTAQQNYKIAKAQYENIIQRLNQFDTSSGSKVGISLKSPIDGKVVKQLALSGSYVNEGDSILHIVNPKKLLLNVRIPQSEVSKVTKPLGVELILDDNSFSFNVAKDTKFLYFSDIIDPKTRCASLVFEINNPPSFLKAGIGYAAKAYTGKIVKTLAILKSSIVNDNGLHVVYVQVGGESFERRNIETGMSAGDYIEIKSGVNDGEHVVSKGAYQVLLSALSPAAAGAGHAH